METPLIFQNKPNNTSSGEVPLIYQKTQSVVERPLIFGGTPTPQAPVAIQNPAISNQQPTTGQNILGGVKSIGGTIKELVAPEGMGIKQVVERNLKNFVEYLTYPQKVATKLITEAGKSQIKEFAATGSAEAGIVSKAMTGKQNLLPEELETLKSKGYIDNSGNISLGKTSLEAAKRTFDLAIFFPQLFAPLELITKGLTGGNIIRILGKSVPVAKVLEGEIVFGAYNTLYTPNLDKIFSDKRVAGEAGKRLLTGIGIGGLAAIPLEMIRDPGRALSTEVKGAKGTPDAFKTLPVEQQQEIKKLYIDLARKYHPDSLIAGDEKTFNEINKRYNDLDIEWMRKLNNASPEEAKGILGLKPEVKPTENVSGTPANLKEEAQVNLQKTNEKLGQALQKSDTGPVPEGKPEVKTVETPVQKELKANLELTNKRFSEALSKSDNAPIPEGYARTYQAVQKGQTSDQVFTKEEDLRNYLQHDATGDMNFNIEDYKKTDLQDIGNGISLVKKDATPYEIVKPKVVSVPREQLPVGTGEKTVSRLEARMKQTLDDLSDEQIDKLGLTTSNTMKNPDQIKKASEYVLNNIEDAMKVLQGDLEPPKGLLRNSIYVAMTHMEDLPLNLATKLAGLSSKRFGQEIEILKEVNKDSPVKLMSDVIKIRADTIKKTYGKEPEQVIKDEVRKLKKEVKPITNNEWLDFLKEIEC